MLVAAEAGQAWKVAGADTTVKVRSLNTDLVSSLYSASGSALVEADFRDQWSRAFSLQVLVLIFSSDLANWSVFFSRWTSRNDFGGRPSYISSGKNSFRG